MAGFWAILLAGVMIAAAILVANHWEIEVIQPAPISRTGGNTSPYIIILNRWTGALTECSSFPQPPVGSGIPLICHAE